ncbi:hypothetical protein P170DRAFT_119378 [Aspergillus steynii IBT 23096]|uniref:BHLH domain-containing protein n=1 Tax=Aspergillus steynii IBT 23096 TaxID=1392250 RepID=A0A2I2GJB8_9EURO|nr:uncharacterized protein P170DRAFT_119378 [Aspergillus steynii IBT 23096]PLB52970.1 hypothetical protein P170DRAFT_119378 [Aspergillus steynii IBT 23096]
MWGKMSFHRSRKPVIGNPTLVNKTLNDDVYQSMSSVSGMPGGDRYYSSKTLPALPPKTAGSSFPARRPESGHRVASSVYSRDTVVDPVRQRSISLTQSTPQDQGSFAQSQYSLPLTISPGISPPDTPTSTTPGPRSRSSSQVSAIDEEPKQGPAGGAPMDYKFSSHLPVLSKRGGSSHTENSQLPPGSRSSSRSNATMWDSFSGDPTMSDHGRAGQAAPGGVSFQTHISANPKSSGSQSTSIFGKGKEQLLPKKVRGRLSKGENSLPPAVREPWKGPSGRSPIVAPIQEKPLARSASRLRISPSNDRLRDNAKPSLDYSSYGIVPSVVTTITGGETADRRAPSTSASAHSSRTRLPSSRENLVSTSTSATSHAPPRVDLPVSDLDASLADLKLTTDDDTFQPSSRFSVTTYEPTEASSSTTSRRTSVDTASQSTENFSSIMSRKRPVPSAVAPSKKPSRKPTPSQASNEDAVSIAPTELSPEEQAESRIESLEARKDSLIRRRNNINTIIHELTQVIQPSSVAYDMAAREEVKKTVSSLNNELAEIKREEHEIGLKLFRAWKKRDERNNYGGGSGLWVKRVTS